METIIIREADEPDGCFADLISQETERSARARGTGISHRTPASIRQKMAAHQAVIAVTDKNEWVGYAYLESWSNGEFVSNSGLIISPAFRNRGVASGIKQKIVELARRQYPKAKLFSITTALAIMKMNSRMGFQPVPFSEITQDKAFWNKCSSCVNYAILCAKGFKNCLCTAFLYDPQEQETKNSLTL